MLHVNHKKFMLVQIHNHNSCVYDDWEFYMLFNFIGVGVEHELTYWCIIMNVQHHKHRIFPNVIQQLSSYSVTKLLY